MRRLALIFAGGAVWLFLLVIPVLADNGPHQAGQFIGTTPESCANCHRAHSATVPYILRTALPTLCYACHGAGTSGSALDVQDGVAYGSDSTTHVAGAPASAAFIGALRGGGFDYALIDTSHVATTGSGSTLKGNLDTIGVLDHGVGTTSSHSVDGSPVTMWGAGAIDAKPNAGKANVELTCGSCHDPHGNGQYRILKPTPSDTAGVVGTDIVKVNDVSGTKIYYTSNYGQLGTFGSNDATVLNANLSSIQYDPSTKTWTGTFAEAASRWCTTCHSRYMGYRGSAGQIPSTAAGTGDAVFAYKHATRNLVDPKNPLASSAIGILTPINTGEGVSTSAVLGCYTSGSTTYYGVAILPKAGGSGGPADCANNMSGLLSGSTTPVRPDDTTLTTGAPRCITCHVSHGSNAAMASNITSQSSPGYGQVAAPNLDSTLLRLNNRGVCEACHNK